MMHLGGHVNLPEQLLQPQQSLNLSEVDQRAGIDQDEASHLFKVSRSALASLALPRIAGMPKRDGC